MKKRLLILSLLSLLVFGGCKKNNKENQGNSDEQQVVSLVTFSETSITLPEERNHQLVATIDSSLNNYLKFWSSENEDIATVSDEGLVTAVSKGNTIIVLQVGKYFARCAVEVVNYVPNDALSVYLPLETYTLNTNDDFVISPTLRLGGSVITSGYNVAAESSNAEVATFNTETLAIHAASAGQCDILLTFTYQTHSVEQQIFVNVY